MQFPENKDADRIARDMMDNARLPAAMASVSEELRKEIAQALRTAYVAGWNAAMGGKVTSDTSAAGAWAHNFSMAQQEK